KDLHSFPTRRSSDLNTGLVAQRFADRLTEHDRNVLHSVVSIDVRVAGCAHREVGQRVLCECSEHVIEERHRRVDMTLTFAVKVEDRKSTRLNSSHVK